MRFLVTERLERSITSEGLSVTSPGCPIRLPDATEEPGFYSRRYPHPSAGHRRQHRDFQLRGRGSVEAVALPPPGAHLHGLGKAARVRSQWHLDTELSGLGEPEHRVRPYGVSKGRFRDDDGNPEAHSAASG